MVFYYFTCGITVKFHKFFINLKIKFQKIDFERNQKNLIN